MRSVKVRYRLGLGWVEGGKLGIKLLRAEKVTGIWIEKKQLLEEQKARENGQRWSPEEKNSPSEEIFSG